MVEDKKKDKMVLTKWYADKVVLDKMVEIYDIQIKSAIKQSIPLPLVARAGI